ncbi:glycosyltransferase [uncultured Winogradskyella sp.]|uniref:glycosyltransferase family 2 protein n=1 Tax=uncultured Winogradskyella sp. TaxID=395353 RepID=UPI00263107B6|nr:glycosyltransferase [uncultured Winogradskyella sp.]
MLTSLAIIIIIIYLFLIGWFAFGFDKVDDFKLRDLPPKTKFSIVIPFRNEAKNLPKLLASISELNYPKSMFEIIFIDDESEDESVRIINDFLKNTDFDKPRQAKYIRIIKNERTSDSPKKDAITSAIQTSKNDWIITTDADCILPKYWLDTFDEFIQTKDSNCIVAPVTYHGNNSFFNRFQTLDFLSLQGATIGGFGIKNPFMSNGANFGYRKLSFVDVNGFDGNTNISSGDDIFLLEKLAKQDAKQVHYLKSQNAIVTTNPTNTISGLIQQRLRWASKTSSYDNRFAKLVGMVVLLGNLTCIAFIPLVLLNLLNTRIVVALIIIKFSIDFLLLFKTSRFFKQETLLLSYIFSSIIYPFFNVSIAFLSFFKSYRWKGRTSKK